MIRKLVFLLFLCIPLFLTACERENHVDLIEKVVTTIEQHGFELNELNIESGLFGRRDTKYKIFSLNGNNLYILYDKDNHEKILRAVLAETEFMYPTVHGVYPDYSLLFTQSTDDPTIRKDIEELFLSLLESNQ